MPAPRLSFQPEIAAKLAAFDGVIVITGGGGWIGQAVLEMLEGALGTALPDRVAVFGSSARDLTLRSGTAIGCRLLDDLAAWRPAKPVLLVHCAFLTKDRLADQSVESFVAANQAISNIVAAFAEAVDLRGLFMPSSGAVYKKGTHVLDDNMQANAYGVMKQRDEERFLAIAHKKKAPACVPRLFNLAGPFINKLDIYALSSMIVAALRNEPIVIRAAHKVVRSYIHVQDLVRLAFAMMLSPLPDDVPVFDTVGDCMVEVGELAERIKTVLGREQAVVTRPPVNNAMEDVYVGSGADFARMMQARRQGTASLEQQIRDTVNFVQERR